MNANQKNVRKQAVALSYDQHSTDAPKVIAKGKGKIAETIIDKAKNHHVPIQEDPSLVNLLTEINLNESIPEELYQAVAEVFAFIIKTDKSAGNRD